MTKIFGWINEINTTAVRVLVSVGLASFAIIAIVWGILWRNWLPTTEQMRVLEGVALVILTMMGFDVLQFASKRFSDKGYAEAKARGKHGPSPVTVEAPSTVKIAPAPEGDTTAPAGSTEATAIDGPPAATPRWAADDLTITPLTHRESERGEGL